MHVRGICHSECGSSDSVRTSDYSDGCGSPAKGMSRGAQARLGGYTDVVVVTEVVEVMVGICRNDEQNGVAVLSALTELTAPESAAHAADNIFGVASGLPAAEAARERRGKPELNRVVKWLGVQQELMKR